MSGDYSRWTSNPRNDFAAVLLQQGRVLTDADWNEQAVTTQRRIQAEALDVIGRAGVPSETPDGFKITLAGAALSIGPGRAYVDGILAENHGLPADEWAATLAELVGTSSVPYDEQPHLPSPPAVPAAGKVLVYLKVWRRELTAVDEPSLVEPALGVDTTSRLRTVWQVKAIQVPASYVPGAPFGGLASFLTAEPPATARLTVGTTAVEVDPSPCQIAPTGGYTGVENQLYRVEVHTPGPAGTATFKWSRDNATVAARVETIPATLDRLVVDRLGPDDVLSFHDGEWVEIIDEARELAGSPGLMRRIRSGGGVDEATRTLLLTQPVAPGEFDLDAQGRPVAGTNLRVRRWDQGTTVFDEAGNAVVDAALADGTITVPAAGTALILEHGITVGFSTDPANGDFRTGDYWLIPARTADPTGHEKDDEPALGIHAHYAALAVIDGGTVTDVRDVFPPLTGLDALFYVAGDGQEVTPDTLAPAPVPLPIPPTVGVARGPLPVAGRVVRFTLTGGGSGTINGGAAPVAVTTGPDGTASVAWSVDPAVDEQTLEARLLDGAGVPTALPVRFSARNRRAATVAYQPGDCAHLAGVNTVQEALDTLCHRGGGSAGCCATVGKDGDYPTLEEALRDLAAKHDGDVCVCLLPGEHQFEGPEIDFVRRLHLHGCGALLVLTRPLVVIKAETVELSDLEIVGSERRLVFLLSCLDVRLSGVSIRTDSEDAETLVHLRACGSVRIRDCSMVAAAQRTGNRPPRFTGPVRRLIEAARDGNVAEIERVAVANRRSAVARREVVARQLDEFAASPEGVADAHLAQAARTAAELFRGGAHFDKFHAMQPDLAALARHLDAGRSRAAIVIEEPSGPAWITGNDITGGLSLYGVVGPERIDELESRLGPILDQARDPFAVKTNDARLDLHQNRLSWTLVAGHPREVIAFSSARIGENVIDDGLAEIAAGRVSFSGNDVENDGRLAGVVYANKATATANVATGREPILVLSAMTRTNAANAGLAVLP